MSLFRRILTAVAQATANRFITTSSDTEGQFGQYRYHCSTITVQNKSVTQVVIDLPYTISGQVYLRAANAAEAFWDSYRKLESIEFNNRVKVYATNQRLAFQVLSPDFMAWLLDEENIPQLYIIEQRCFLAALNTTQTKAELLAQAQTILKYIEHSGAYEKTAQ